MPAKLKSETHYSWRCAECSDASPEAWPTAQRAIASLEIHNAANYRELARTEDALV